MLGVIIGSGIFRTPSDIADHLGSPGLIILMWAVGGLLSLFGALTYTELVVVFPRSGGLYNFLYQGFGRGTAFVFGWTYMLISKPFAAAAITTIFAQYLHLNGMAGKLLIEHFGFDPAFSTDLAEPIAVCILLIGLTYLNVRGMRLGAGAGVVVTTLKVLALAAICVLAVIIPGGSIENFDPITREKSFFAAIAPVMTSILWTYDGWSDVGSVAGEVKSPQRTLPRVYLVGTLLAVALYVAINAAYMYVLPIDAIANSNSVAGDLMTKLLGPAGGVILTAMVLISTLGSTHASIITGARVTFAQAQDGLLFHFLARIHPKYQTPHIALWVQCTLSCIAVLFLREFSSLAGGFVFTIWIFYGLAAVAVVMLRIRRPDLPRTYKTPGYPLVPLLFIASAFAMTALSIADSPKQTLPWLGILVAGYPIYLIWTKLNQRAAA
jgi:amino acid transporter